MKTKKQKKELNVPRVRSRKNSQRSQEMYQRVHIQEFTQTEQLLRVNKRDLQEANTPTINLPKELWERIYSMYKNNS
jgi:putative cell wall-binding protein